MGPPTARTIISTSVDPQSKPNLQNNPPTTLRILTSRILKLEKLFSDETTSYTSITSGIYSHLFYDNIRQLECGHSDIILWKIPSVKFVFDSARVSQPSSDPLIEPATGFSSPMFRTHLHRYNFSKFYLQAIGSATEKSASIPFTLFPGD